MEQKIICPVCQSEKIKFFCEKNNYKLYRCVSCGLIFIWPVPLNSSEIYSAAYFKRTPDDQRTEKFGYVDYEEDKKATRQTFISYLDRISRLAKGKKVFDVGAATGYFLDIAKERGWQTGGVEISAYAAAIAKNKGHDVFRGDLANLNIGDKDKYDVVTMWDVLEHLTDPVSQVKIINKILNLGGILAINTIDSGSWWARFMGSHWHALVPPEHLFFSSSKSLEQLLAAAGFEILERAKIGKRFTLSYIFKVLAQNYKMPLLGKLSVIFDKIGLKVGLPINLRDNIFIIAKKINDIN